MAFFYLKVDHSSKIRSRGYRGFLSVMNFLESRLNSDRIFFITNNSVFNSDDCFYFGQRR